MAQFVSRQSHSLDALEISLRGFYYHVSIMANLTEGSSSITLSANWKFCLSNRLPLQVIILGGTVSPRRTGMGTGYGWLSACTGEMIRHAGLGRGKATETGQRYDANVYVRTRMVD